MTIGEAIDRIQVLLQDEDASAWPRDTVRRALEAALMRLSRAYLLGEIVWMNAISGQGRYDLPPEMFMVSELLYDGQSLRGASEASLRRTVERWEQRTDAPPAWFTQEQQPMTINADGAPVKAVEVIPAPMLTGSTIPVIPGLPLTLPLEDNLVAFGWVDVQPTVAEETPLQVTDIVGQIAIYSTVAALAGESGDYQDQQKHLFFEQLAQVLTKAVVP